MLFKLISAITGEIISLKHGNQSIFKTIIKKSKPISILNIFIKIRDQTSQTKVDNYSNVAQPKTYLAGLRGVGRSLDGTYNNTTMTKYDLTLSVDHK